MVLREILTILRFGGLAEDPNFRRQVDAFISTIGSEPQITSGNNRGTAFSATGPKTLAEQRRLMIQSELNDTTLPFSGL